MARYVMANRRAGKFQEVEKKASRSAIDANFNHLFAASVDVVNDRNPVDPLARRVLVFDAEPAEVAAKAATLSADVMVEPEILHYPTAFTAGADAAALLDMPLAGPQATFLALVTGGGLPVRGAKAILFVADPLNRQRRLEQVTDVNGAASFSFAASLRPLGVIVEPAGGFWSAVFRNVASGVPMACPPIVDVGPIDWWHTVLGIQQFDVQRGAGIKVGVIDTGAGPHGCLAHVRSVGAFINGAHDPAGGADVDAHGSHTTGTIGARPVRASQRGGIAPGVTLFIARVFPGPEDGASQADIANALDELSREQRVDLINMSLGADRPSDIELDAIRDALQRGTLCVCAAGNDGGAVGWPAAFAEAVAVSAIGLKGAAPAGSLSALSVPTDPTRFGKDNLFLADFSNFGPETDCCTPGVGIVATVPERFGLKEPYAAMDGTSMASPVACGALASLLADTPSYQTLTGSARAEHARTILSAHCRSIGLAAVLQGRGLPQVP